MGVSGWLLSSSISYCHDCTRCHSLLPQSGTWCFHFPVGGLILLLVLLGIYVDHYLRKVDMLEALKSVD